MSLRILTAADCCLTHLFHDCTNMSCIGSIWSVASVTLHWYRVISDLLYHCRQRCLHRKSERSRGIRSRKRCCGVYLVYKQVVLCRRSCLVCCPTAASWVAAVAVAAVGPRPPWSNCPSPADSTASGSCAVSAATATRIRSTAARCFDCATPKPERSNCQLVPD